VQSGRCGGADIRYKEEGEEGGRCQTAVDGMMLLLLFCLPLVLLSGLAGRPWDRVTGPGLLAPDIRPGTSLV
jgi:hypothetical protein